jgi:uncharacterized SAM-binding protein YcdF (DUF218 family)
VHSDADARDALAQEVGATRPTDACVEAGYARSRHEQPPFRSYRQHAYLARMDRPRTPWYRQKRILTAGVAIVTLCWTASVCAVIGWSVQDDARRADAIIVMGAAQYAGHPSPVLRARLDHAVELWKRGLAPRTILTGGIGTGETVSEAAVGRAYVRSRGVPDTAILLENEGRTSSESLRAAAELMHARGLRDAIVVSDPFHMLRLEILGRRFGIVPFTSPALPAAGPRRPIRQWGNLVAESIKAPLSLLLDW